MSGPWKRRYRPTVAEQDQNELLLRITFIGGPILILAVLALRAL